MTQLHHQAPGLGRRCDCRVLVCQQLLIALPCLACCVLLTPPHCPPAAETVPLNDENYLVPLWMVSI